MDEATFQLDPAYEEKVNSAIGRLGITRIIIAHRSETIAAAERVLRLQHGKLTESVGQALGSNCFFPLTFGKDNNDSLLGSPSRNFRSFPLELPQSSIIVTTAFHDAGRRNKRGMRMSNTDKNPRLVGRQFATPLTDEEITQVAGGCGDSNNLHPGPGTCTTNNDDD